MLIKKELKITEIQTSSNESGNYYQWFKCISGFRHGVRVENEDIAAKIRKDRCMCETEAFLWIIVVLVIKKEMT